MNRVKCNEKKKKDEKNDLPDLTGNILMCPLILLIIFFFLLKRGCSGYIWHLFLESSSQMEARYTV